MSRRAAGKAKPEDKCLVCDKAVLDKDKGLQCEFCELWYHSGCQNLSDDAYSFMSEFETIHWYCLTCNKHVGDILKQIKDVNTQQDKFEVELNKVKDELVEMQTKVKTTDDLAKSIDTKLGKEIELVKIELVQMKTEVKTTGDLAETIDTKIGKEIEQVKIELVEMKTEVKSTGDLAKTVDTKLETVVEASLVNGFDQKVEIKVNDKVKHMKDDVEESMEIERRKNNLVFHGVKESVTPLVNFDQLGSTKSEDQELVEELLKSGLRLDATRHIEGVQRIGRFVQGKIRPLRVAIKTFEARNEILKRARDLQNSTEFKRIFIAPDLTRKQQQIDKELRDKVKEFRSQGMTDVKIKSGKVIKNELGKQVVVLYQPMLASKTSMTQ